MQTLNLNPPLRGEAGAFDLPSIITGATVVGVLTAGVLASVFGVIPFSQDHGARQDLSAVKTAQGTAKTQYGSFMNQAALGSSGLVGGFGDRLTVTSSDASEFCATALSPTGKLFSITESMSEAAETDICNAWEITDPALRAAVIAELDGNGGGMEPVSYTTPAGGSVVMIRTAEVEERKLTLRDAAKITHLDLTGSDVNSLEGIQEASNLKTLILDGTAVTNLGPAAEVAGLTSISMKNTSITNIAPLTGLQALASVDATGTTVSDWSPLNHVAQVTATWVVSDTNLRDRVTDTLAMPRSAPLTIADARNLGEMNVDALWTDYAPLKAAFNARVGVYPDTQAKLDRVKLIPNLTFVYVGGGAGISSIDALTGLPKLEKVELYNTYLTSISALNGMTSIKHLNLPDSVTTIATVATLPNLEDLWLSQGSNMPDLSPVAGLVKLKNLQVPFVVSDFSAIASLRDLEYAGVDGNPNLVSLTVFAGLENLKRVSLTGTPASEGLYDTDWSALNHVGWVDGRPANANLTAEQRQGAWVIPDQSLRESIAMEVGKAPGDLIIADAGNLQMLRLQGDVASLEGLQYAGNLMDLDISFTAVSDITPLSGLRSLQMLQAHGTMVTDWSPVAHVDNVMGRP